MAQERIHLKRETLYEQVWSRPLIELAKEYGLSDVGLAKICRRLRVPLPGRGYWMKQKVGRAPTRPPLPTLKKDDIEEVYVSKPVVPPADPETMTEAERLIVFESLADNLIVVAPTLASPHPLVARTAKSLRLAKPDEHGLLHPHEKECLPVHVGRHSLSRALRIMDALIKALEARGHAVVPSVNAQRIMTVNVLGIPVVFELREQLERRPHQPTPAEQAAKKRTPWYLIPTHDYVLTGKLNLGIKSWSDGTRCNWGDGKKQRLEDCLNGFVVSLIKVAVRQKARELERERWHREWEERRRREEEEERIRREEEARLQELEEEAANWQRAQRIRAYVEAVKQSRSISGGPGDSNSGLENWIVWARQQANRIDPLQSP